MKLPDPRTAGSKNPGATNILRLAGKLPAIVALLGDMLKGLIPVVLAKLCHVEGIMLGFVGFAAFVGHLYPIFFKFKGGKGVATFFGVTFGLSIPIGFALIITWLIVALLFRYSSLSALVAAITAPIYIAIFENIGYLIPLLLMVLLIIWKHRDNIKRLTIGEESKIHL
jgi:glycerol-3-phosphate acyltransferase PlsY